MMKRLYLLVAVMAVSLPLWAQGPVITTPYAPASEGAVNPYLYIEAGTMIASEGVEAERLPGRGLCVTGINDGDWIEVGTVDFGEKPACFVSVETLRVRGQGRIEFYLDKIEGDPFVGLDILGEYAVKTSPIGGNITGKHDLFILFKGGEGELFDFDWWKFNDYVNMPVIQTKYTADPAPMVYDGTVYLYTTHDADDSGRGFSMFDWLLYSSTDMVNWTDHGAVASLRSFDWYDGNNGAWALQVAERNGKFYMYCPIHGHGIGVLVADSPYGPFVDPLGEPLVWQKEHWEDIDPTVFIDDDGQAYMYWGNPNVYWVTLNEDMISYSGEIHKLDYKIDDYQEGPWFYKRDGHYYLAFASTCCPEGIGYAMSDSPTGPWKAMGPIMDHTQRTRGNHPGIIDFKGRSYVFGLNYDLMHIETFYHHERRSVSMAEMHYNPDGTIQKVPYWQDNYIEQVEPFNPYRKVEAETMAWGYGLKTEDLPDGGIALNNIDEGEYLLLKGVDFGKRGARRLRMNVRSGRVPACVEVRLDAPDGPLAGTLDLKDTRDAFKTLSCRLKGEGGVHDLYFVFKGGNNLFEWDWWKMKRNTLL